ncbi:MAG: helix-turn-helix transcriptional regulator [Planctomycetia bacterium]|nr:helix-turn-helix transcriptional regulator [Planctomycetia bacterium]
MSALGRRESRISDRSRTSNGNDAVRIVVTNRQYGEWCRGSIRRLPRSARSKLDLLTFPSWYEVVIPRTPRKPVPTIFVSRLADVVVEAAKKAREAGRSKHLLFSEGMPIEALASRLPRLDVRDANRVHVAREGDAESIAAILYRLFRGIAQPKEAHSILDAWVEGEDIVLLSPSFARLSVPLGKLTKFIGEPKKEIKAFEIDEDGRFLFWPHADVHLGWEQMRQILDPTAAIATEEKTEQFNRGYGSAVRRLREERELKQAAIDGLSERHVRRIEQGRQPVTSSALRALAKAHDMPVEDYLKEVASRLPSVECCVGAP